MVRDGFSKLRWGFLFIMIDFKLQGFDIFPDIVGYILFAIGLGALAQYSEGFQKASKFNVPMIVLSVFSIYEKPNQGSGIQLGIFGPFGILIGIASVVLGLILVYNIFKGIKEMADYRNEREIYDEADSRWNQYLILQLASLFAFFVIFIPPLALIYIFGLLIASVILTIAIMRFMNDCGDKLKEI